MVVLRFLIISNITKKDKTLPGRPTLHYTFWYLDANFRKNGFLDESLMQFTVPF